jgi:hypothetical protein
MYNDHNAVLVCERNLRRSQGQDSTLGPYSEPQESTTHVHLHIILHILPQSRPYLYLLPTFLRRVTLPTNLTFVDVFSVILYYDHSGDEKD